MNFQAGDRVYVKVHGQGEVIYNSLERYFVRFDSGSTLWIDGTDLILTPTYSIPVYEDMVI